MLHRSHKGKSGPRSNMYSRVRCSNWARFDPFDEEADRIQGQLRPATTLPVGAGQTCSIFVADVNARFIQPVTADEVVEVLASVPAGFLRDLESLLILGGTGKQDRLAEGRLFHYGCYRRSRRRICLHAFPKRLLMLRLRRPLRPSDVRVYQRAGAEYRFERGRWTLEFNAESLRRFYLHDVLLHEVGHHVDRHNDPRPTVESERFAMWFAEKTARERRARARERC